MSNSIIKYDPLVVITTYSNKRFYIQEKNLPVLEQKIQTSKFIKIWEANINVSSIDTIEPANFYDNILQVLPLEKQNTVKREVDLWEEKTWKTLTQEVLQKIIDTRI